VSPFDKIDALCPRSNENCGISARHSYLAPLPSFSNERNVPGERPQAILFGDSSMSSNRSTSSPCHPSAGRPKLLCTVLPCGSCADRYCLESTFLYRPNLPNSIPPLSGSRNRATFANPNRGGVYWPFYRLEKRYNRLSLTARIPRAIPSMSSGNTHFPHPRVIQRPSLRVLTFCKLCSCSGSGLVPGGKRLNSSFANRQCFDTAHLEGTLRRFVH